MASGEVRVIGVAGLPEVAPGDDLASLIIDAAARQNTPIQDADVLVVTQKVVSKAEGRLVDLRTVEPSPFARHVAQAYDKDPRLVEVILRESRRIVRMDRGVLITETRHGFICANAGVDASNVAQDDTVALLPEDPDASAQAIRAKVREQAMAEVAVVISDSFGRPWREGVANVAVGVAGMLALKDYTG
ncbi:MAG: coenzyme F420-0:L-glutamate ligase, partial [Dehalococcoidia bacterium]